MHILPPPRTSQSEAPSLDTVEQMLHLLPDNPGYHEVDHLLDRAGQVLDALQMSNAQKSCAWKANRRWRASNALSRAIDALDTAMSALIIDEDQRSAVAHLAGALPEMRSALACQSLSAI
jgi:hypothetical protein